MHAQPIITKILHHALDSMHRARRETLCAAVGAALSGQALSVTALGRRLDSGTDEKHQIERIDRLLSNPHLQQERASIYHSIATQLLARCLATGDCCRLVRFGWRPTPFFCCAPDSCSMAEHSL